MEIKVYETIAKVNADDLENFRDILYSKGIYEFAESEKTEKVAPKYFLGYEKGKAIAFAPAYIQEGPYLFDPFAYLKGRLRDSLGKLGLKIKRIMCVNTPLRPRSDIKILNPFMKARLMPIMLNAMHEEAKKMNCNAVIFPSMLESNEELQKLLVKNGYIRAFHDVYFYMETGFSTYDNFLKSLKKIRRDNLKYDATVIAKYGIKIDEITDINQFAAEYAALHKAVMKKYGHDESELDEKSFRSIYEPIGNTSSLVARKDGETLGFTLNIYDKECCHALRCGQFHEKAEHMGVYFNLVYNETIKKAISLGCMKVDYGQAMHRAKIMRGCKYEKMYLYAKFFNPLTHNLMKIKIKRLGKGYYDSFQKEIKSKPGDNAAISAKEAK